MADLSLPIDIRPQFDPWLDCNINNISYTYLRQLQLKLDANRGSIRDLAAAVPKSPWTRAKVDDILCKDSPGEELLHLLGVLNKNLREVIGYMRAIDFWPGLEIFLKPFPPIIRQDLPRKINLRKGESLTLHCKAAGIPSLIYQWYYYPNQKPVKIEGEKNASLNISQPEWLHDRSLVCSICNVEGQIHTAACHVTIDMARDPRQNEPTETKIPMTPKPTSYTAKDKVALLIGNGEYMAEKKLSAPPNDILRIGKVLKKMQFKTLICKDLTKASMENVLDFFINLLVEDGVYGVLYFAGHGFETNRGVCYLVPSDSPTQATPASCVSARKVHNQILEKNPALCLVVLDICRVRKDEESVEREAVKANSSTMVVYATNEDKKAYEMQGQGNEPLSVFASHLLKYLHEPIPLIDLMMQRVVPSISKDRVANKHGQLAEITTTLSTQRSLHDRVDFKGATTKYEKCMLDWESVNQRPELQEHYVPMVGVTVKMVFTYEYSNSLTIFIGCIKKDADVAFKAFAHVSSLDHVGLKCEATQLLDPEHWPPKMGFKNNMECLSVTKNVLDGIENLDGDLIVNVTVSGSRQDRDQVSQEITGINLKRPLLAKLNFANMMKGKRAPLRVPVQHEESNAVEHDESFYQQVALEQGSLLHSLGHSTMHSNY